jgi:hypothetical protein
MFFGQKGDLKMTVNMTENMVEKCEEIRQDILKKKAALKELAAIQKEEKQLLRMPHHKIPTIDIKLSSGNVYSCGGINRAGRLMNSTRDRAEDITQLHIQYNIARGKPYDMHEYKERNNG